MADNNEELLRNLFRRLELRPYQEEAARRGLFNDPLRTTAAGRKKPHGKNLIIELPTGTGKTLTIVAILLAWLYTIKEEPDEKSIIITPNVTVATQWFAELAKKSVRSRIICRSSQRGPRNARILITTISTLTVGRSLIGNILIVVNNITYYYFSPFWG